jgi:hypothetical protein
MPDLELVAPTTRSTIASRVSDFRRPPYGYVAVRGEIGGIYRCPLGGRGLSRATRASIAPIIVITDREIRRMARETIYLVQAYTQGKRARLNADSPIRCKSSESARRTAERLAATKAGVVAFSTSGDVELGEYDEEPVVFFKTGRLPPQFQDQ